MAHFKTKEFPESEETNIRLCNVIQAIESGASAKEVLYATSMTRAEAMLVLIYLLEGGAHEKKKEILELIKPHRSLLNKRAGDGTDQRRLRAEYQMLRDLRNKERPVTDITPL